MKVSIDLLRILARLLLVPWYLVPAVSALAAEESEGEEVYELSPFTVETSEDDVGYYASHTLAGSRMNTKLRDLAASITVVTAQQLEDTSSVDINDVFLYEANTEGTYTYTEFAVDGQGSFNDSAVQMTPQTANRVRGIGSPDRAVDYFIGIDDIPQDSYNIDRLTINRGPNSVLYGLGSAAGLVNTTLARAYVGTESNRVDLRVGSWGDFRSSFSLNRTLIEDKLAVRLAAVYHDRGYPQEPSYDYTRRVYGTLTYQPFENTNIRAYYENYNTDYSRPGAATPQDSISHWRAAGSPTFNPSTMMVTRGGVQYPITSTSGAELSAASNTGLTNHPHNTRFAFFTEDGETFPLRLPRQIGDNEFGTGTNFPERMVTSNATPPPEGLGNWFPPGITDKSIYNWEDINLRAGNAGVDDADSYQVMLEQQLFEDLFIEVGWRREELERFTMDAYTSGNNEIFVDVNETYIDGTPNPGFLKPYIEGWEPTSRQTFNEAESLRGTVAYELDFTDNDGWISWLGRHNIMGFAEERESEVSNFRWREQVISEHNFGTDPGSISFSGPNIVTRMNRVYYLGNNGVITKSPQAWPMRAPGIAGEDYPEGVIGRAWNHTTRRFVPTFVDDGEGGTEWAGRDGDMSYPVPGGRPIGEWVDEELVHATTLHDAWSDQNEVSSQAAVLQSYLWDDRIIGTLGWRKDTRNARATGGARGDPGPNAQGFLQGIPEHLNDYGEWDEVDGYTQTKGVVVFPFANWSADLPEFLTGLSAHYNESDTFTPEGLAQNRFFEILPLPSGDGKDWGFAFSLLENKLVVKVNWYEAAQANSRNITQSGRVNGRTPRQDDENGWGFFETVLTEISLQNGIPVGTYDFGRGGGVADIPSDILSQMASMSGLSVETLMNWRGQQNGIPIRDTFNIASEGMEISLDYNPTRNWSIKFTAGQQETIEPAPTAPATQRWLYGEGGTFENPQPDGRLAVWQSFEYHDTRDLPEGFQPGDSLAGIPTRRWWTTPDVNGTSMPSWGSTPENWYLGVIEGILQVALETQGLSNPQVREWRWSAITNYRFTEGKLAGWGVGGSVRWEDEGSIGYLARPNNPRLLDGSQPLFDDDRYYYDFWTSYSTRIFDDRVRMKLQLNLRDAFHSPGLRVIASNSDGSPRGFRIENGRQWFLSSTFEF